MTSLFASLILLAGAGAAHAAFLVDPSAIGAVIVPAASQSSNSSSNSSNGITTRVDTYSTIDDRGRRTYRQRIYRERIDRPSRWRRDIWRDRDDD